MKNCFALLGTIFILSGCLATTDLVEEPMLPASERALLQKISVQAKAVCQRVTYDQSGNNTVGSSYKFTQKFNIKRYYVSSTDWVKVEANSSGVWDNIFFNKTTNQMVCGQKTWDSYSDVSGIAFSEYGRSPKTIGDANLNQTQTVFQSLLLAQQNTGKSWDEIEKQDRQHSLSSLSLTQLCQSFKNKTIEETVIRRELIRRGENGLACDVHEGTTALASVPRQVIVISPTQLTQICNDAKVIGGLISKLINSSSSDQPNLSTKQVNSAVKRLESSLAGYDEQGISEIIKLCN